MGLHMYDIRRITAANTRYIIDEEVFRRNLKQAYEPWLTMADPAAESEGEE